jgi:hypothetical protein
MVKPTETDPEVAREIARLERELRDLRTKGARKDKKDEESESARKFDREREKARELAKRLFVRVLEIDPETGKLYFRNPDRVEVRNQADAEKLFKQDQEQQKADKRELYYLILYPRDPTSDKPELRQREDYDRWFSGVALGYDIPSSSSERKP